jgi:GcrA cell cycle regulator
MATCGTVVGIQALNQATCRWPIGDPQRDGFGYCGARSLTGRPYCEAHAKLAYEPPRERRRAS